VDKLSFSKLANGQIFGQKLLFFEAKTDKNPNVLGFGQVVFGQSWAKKI
jgi:hypothetical protein